MKYFVEFTTPDPINDPYNGVYNIWYKRWWWSRKKVIKKDYVADGGIATVINCVLEPHMKSFNTCVAWSDATPEPREINL